MDTNFLGKEATTDLKLAHFPIHSPPPIAALPSMSLIPSAPFTDNIRLRTRLRRDRRMELTEYNNCDEAGFSNSIETSVPSVISCVCYDHESRVTPVTTSK